MLKKRYLSLALFLILIFVSGCEKAPKKSNAKAADSIKVIDPKIRALPPGQTVTALYFQLKNNSNSTYQLVKAESNFSEFVEIHENTMVDGVMKMGEVQTVDVADNSTVDFKPSGYHIMLINLKKELKLGNTANVALVFNDGSRLSFTAEVKQIDVQ